MTRLTPEQAQTLRAVFRGLDAEQLGEVFELAKDAYSRLQHRQASRFEKGDRVSFQDRNRRTVTGTVLWINAKTVTVEASDGRRWRVAPSLLAKTVLQDPLGVEQALTKWASRPRGTGPQ